MKLVADTVIHGQAAVTMALDDSGRSESIAVKDGRILAIGSREAVDRYVGKTTVAYDLPGSYILPGLADIHTHVAGHAEQRSRGAFVECRDLYDSVPSLDVMLSRMHEAAERLAPGEWLVGRGSPMQQYRLAEKRLPTRWELDDVLSRNPAYITFGGHVLVANSRALDLVGITSRSVSPEGGVIERDDAGELTGLLRERAQNPLHKDRRRAYTVDMQQELEDRLESALKECARYGVTTVHDIVRDPAEVRAYVNLERSGRLPLRVQLLIRVIESAIPKWSVRDLGLTSGFGSTMLSLGGVKMSIDGGFTGGRGAFSAIAGETTDREPLIRISQHELDEAVHEYNRHGVRVCVHAIGDVAFDMALNAFEQALSKYPVNDHRHRIEHMGNWLMTDERCQRARDLGLVPVPNPPFLYYLGEEAQRSLGTRRMAGALPLRTMLEHDLTVGIASDGPGPWRIDPLRDVGSVIHRRTMRGGSMGDDEGLDISTGLSLVTREAARIGFVEADLGTLCPGKFADLVVVDRDPSLMDVGARGGLSIQLTMCEGRITHEALPHS